MKFGMLLIVFSALCFNMLTFSNALPRMKLHSRMSRHSLQGRNKDIF